MTDDELLNDSESVGEKPTDDVPRGSARPDDDTPRRAARSARGSRSSGRHGAAQADARRSAPREGRVSGRGANAARPARTNGTAGAERVPRLGTSAQARRRRLAIALGVLVIIIGLLGYLTWTTLFRADAPGIPAGQRVSVVIEKGSSSEQVATQLAQAGIVANATMFRVQVQLLGAGGELKAGAYVFTTGSDYEPVIRLLQQGPPADPTVTFTIPEGWGIAKTAARIEEKLGIPASEFIELATTGAKQFKYGFLADNKTRSLEGYLFPKTYTVKEGTTATGVINVMLAQYGEETASLDYSYAESKGLSAHDVLTIASIIEREASVASDRPKVASVIYNRLAINMRLQLDSTVQYALNGKVELTLDDLKTDSPYNTYMVLGVPPGPICSPGIVAIKAALAPAKTKYLYYILTHKDGRQSFATNYADFLELKAQYKQGLK